MKNSKNKMGFVQFYMNVGRKLWERIDKMEFPEEEPSEELITAID